MTVPCQPRTCLSSISFALPEDKTEESSSTYFKKNHLFVKKKFYLCGGIGS